VSTARVDVSLILPAFDEARSIRRTVGDAVAYLESAGLSYEILVAADGTDGTRESVEEMARSNPRLRTLGTPERRGKGLAVREAAGRAAGELVGFADADGKVPFDEIGRVREAIAGGYDVVVGVRAERTYSGRRLFAWTRRGSAKAFACLVHRLVGLPSFPDTQCGFKFLRREAAAALFPRVRTDGYMFDVELLALAERAGMRVAQLPVRWSDDGDSRFRPGAGSLRNLRELLVIRSALRDAPPVGRR
jgi:dolichyl-phosphate beta-glucosyltransferase